MKIGIIGAGMIVKDVLPKLIKFENVQVISLMEVASALENAKVLCNEYNVPIVTSSFEELCNSGIDTVYVAVPNHLHFEYCKKSLEQGLNVIVEKPMTSNINEALKLKDLAIKNKLFLFEAITTIYLEGYLKIKEWLPRIGDIKNVESNHTQCSSRYNAFKNGEVLPAFDVNKCGGALMDLGLYNLHYVMGLFGKPNDVKYYPTIERGIDTNGLLVLQYPTFTAHCFGAKDCGGNSGGIIQGTNGCIKSSFSPNVVGIVTLTLNDKTEEKFEFFRIYDRTIPEFTAFIQAINNKDYDFCYAQLEKSMNVAEIMTKARLEAGIVFPFDR